MGQYINVEKENGVAVVKIDHPPLNVLSKGVFQELHEAFSELETDRETVVVLLTGEGQRAFVAGADIKEFPEMMGSANTKDNVLEGHRVLNYIDSFPKPTIAVLNGITFGGGCELALTADIRIAEDHIQIGLPEVKLGLFPGGGGTQRLPRLIGPAKAKELMFTGNPITAQEAQAIGLVNDVVPSGQGLNAGIALASKMTGHSLQALSRIKQAVNEGLNRQLNEGIELEAELFAEVFQTEDIKEGVRAFLEKRKPSFQHQ